MMYCVYKPVFYYTGCMCCSQLLLLFIFHFTLNLSLLMSLSSKGILTLVTTTWLKPRQTTSSCQQLHQRSRRSQGTTSQPPRTCPSENLLWWQASWQADADKHSTAPRQPFPVQFKSVTLPLPALKVPPVPHLLIPIAKLPHWHLQILRFV